MFETEPNFSELQRVAHDGVTQALSKLGRKFRENDLQSTVSALGGMLLLPQYQANTLRLEAMLHLAVANCAGRKNLRREDVCRWFKQVGNFARHLEDPIEDVFSTRVIFGSQNYRILEGLAEGGGHYLQLLLEVLETMPAKGNYAKLIGACRSMLALSEALCARAGIEPYISGPEHPASSMEKDRIPTIRTLSGWTTFSAQELRTLGVDPGSLYAFTLPPGQRDVSHSLMGGSALEQKPLLWFDGTLVVALPTAIGVAIRTAVIDACLETGMDSAFRMMHLQTQTQLLSRNPMINQADIRPTALSLQKPIIASEPVEIEPGYWFHLVLFIDDLVGFQEDGFMGMSQRSDAASVALENEVTQAKEYCRAQGGFKAGLTYVVLCGYGRGLGLMTSGDHDWFIEAASTYDTDVLGWLSRFSLSDLFRLSAAERELASKGFEVRHVNGLLAQVGYARANRGHLVPHEALPDGMPGGLLMMPQNAQFELRKAHHNRQDIRAIPTPEGGHTNVRRKDAGARSPERTSRIYCSVEEIMQGQLRGAWVRGKRTWWIRTVPISGVGAGFYGAWDAQAVWMERIAPVLDEYLPDLPDVLLWDLKIDPWPKTKAQDIVTADRAEIFSDIVTRHDQVTGTITTEVGPAFYRGLSNETNVSETALVEAFVGGVLELVGRSDVAISSLLDWIIPSSHARQLHAFAPQDFRDHARPAIGRHVVHIGELQDAAIRIGLGWHGVPRPGGTVRGRSDCTKALNAITSAAEEDLCRDLAQFERRDLIECAVQNHEAAAIDFKLWHQTAGAMIGLAEDEEKIREELHETTFRLNGVSLANRLLIEAGLHECPLGEGMKVADIDLSRLMARAMMIVHLGGYSDAIHYGGMKPEIRISPAGEVQINTDFFNDVMDPVGKDFVDSAIDRKRLTYASHLQEPEPVSEDAESNIEPEFLSAWEAEFGSPLADFRATAEAVENLVMQNGLAWQVLPRPELIALLSEHIKSPHTVVLELESIPRPKWKDIPAGFNDADRQPWRFRRRLSLTRRPLVRFDQSDTADILVAPGMVREALGSTVINMYEGNFDGASLTSKEMKDWASKTANRVGHEFEEEVAAELRALGWVAQTSVKFGSVLGYGLAADPGDIDVLAWHPSGRVALLECKKLQFAKTTSEVAKQLFEFRGEINARGKPDRLTKHLARLDLALSHQDAFRAFTKLPSATLEAALVFSNTVPMKFAEGHMRKQVKMLIAGELESI